MVGALRCATEEPNECDRCDVKSSSRQYGTRNWRRAACEGPIDSPLAMSFEQQEI